MCLFVSLISSCEGKKGYAVGVSQCSENDWRSNIRADVLREARIQGGMTVDVVSADGSPEKQNKDIEEYINEGKDLIIVVPNVASDVRAVVEKAYGKGIPVILVDRKAEDCNYTAFIGADNKNLGMQVAEFIAANTTVEVANVIELVGLEGSSSAKDRHDGFNEGAKKYNNVNLLATANADWDEDEAEQIVSSLLMDHDKVDYIFAHNDRMAMGARKAVEKAGRARDIQIIGIDALATDGGGVDQVINKKFAASFIYPTGGSEAIALAKKILTKQKFDKEVTLPVTLVDSTNASAVKRQYQAVLDQDEALQIGADGQAEGIGGHRAMLVGGVLLVCVIGGIAVFAGVKSHRSKKTDDEMLINNQLCDLVEPQPQASEGVDVNASEATPVDENDEVDEGSFDGNDGGNEDGGEPQEMDVASLDDTFLRQINQIIEERLSDSELSVNSIASSLGISRVQLYRKMKSVSSHNVNEIIRRTRLEKARGMLISTNMTIAEVAYSVGFTSPSYFTKCYKDYFGKSPSELI